MEGKIFHKSLKSTIQEILNNFNHLTTFEKILILIKRF